MRTLLIALLALAALPLAAAQEPEKPANDEGSQDAWVKDCPPDMMCAYGSEGGNETPAGTDEPIPYGDEGCIECTGGPVDDGSTCMDGAQEGETCRDDVQYLDGRGPADCENCRGDAEADPATQAESAATKDVPLPAVLLVLAALAAAVLVVRRA